MAGIGSKKWNNIFGSVLQVDNANTGVDSTIRNVQDGAGNESSVSISKNKALVKPSAADSTAAFQVKNASNNALLTVDSQNNKVLAGTSQVALNTQYVYFGINHIHSANWIVNTHHGVPFMNGGYTDATFDDLMFNTGSDDPTSSFVLTNITGFKSAQLMPYVWYVPDDIIIDEVYHIQGSTGSSSSTDTTRMHLMKYNYATNSSTPLSSGQVVANTSSDTTATTALKTHKNTWSVVPAQKNISAGQVCVCTFRSDSINNDYSLQVIVKYRLA